MFIDYSKYAKNLRVPCVYTGIEIITTTDVYWDNNDTVYWTKTVWIFFTVMFFIWKRFNWFVTKKRIDFIYLNKHNKCYLNVNGGELLGTFGRNPRR